MIEWEYKDYRPEGFECYQAQWGKSYSVSICKLLDTGTRYTVRLYYKGMTQIKEHFDAEDWKEARNIGISIIKDYYNRQATYWRDMKIAFSNWVEEI